MVGTSDHVAMHATWIAKAVMGERERAAIENAERHEIKLLNFDTLDADVRRTALDACSFDEGCYDNSHVYCAARAILLDRERR